MWVAHRGRGQPSSRVRTSRPPTQQPSLLLCALYHMPSSLPLVGCTLRGGSQGEGASMERAGGQAGSKRLPRRQGSPDHGTLPPNRPNFSHQQHCNARPCIALHLRPSRATALPFQSPTNHCRPPLPPMPFPCTLALTTRGSPGCAVLPVTVVSPCCEEGQAAHPVLPVVRVEGEEAYFQGLHPAVCAPDELRVGVDRHIVQLALLGQPQLQREAGGQAGWVRRADGAR